jgi:hypothetical protein
VNLTSSGSAWPWPDVRSHQVQVALATVVFAGLVAVAVLGAVSAGPWRWSLFWWGVAIGVVGIAHNELIRRLSLRLNALPRDRRIRVAGRLGRYSAMWFVLGPLVGGLAAGWNLPWVDLAVGVYAAMVWTSALVVLFFSSRPP